MFHHPNAAFNMTSYRRADLLKIDNRLTSDDLNGMTFLAREVIGHSQLGRLTRAIELIQLLEKRFAEVVSYGVTYSWIDLFQELLFHVGRKDLLKLLNTNKEVIRERLKVTSLVNRFTLLLFEIRQELVPEELAKLQFQDSGVCWDRDMVTDPLDFLMTLEKRAIIDPQTLDNLEEWINSIGRKDILRKIQKYKASCPEQSQQSTHQRMLSSLSDVNAGILYPPSSRLVQGEQSPLSNGPERLQLARENIPNIPLGRSQPRSFYVGREVQIETSFFPEQQPHVQKAHHQARTTPAHEEIGALTEHDEMPRYRMSAEPRGYCIIINNSRFSGGGSSSSTLSDRQGSDIDRDKLHPLFDKLKFWVRSHNDLRGEEMTSTLGEYASLDHSAFDCLVVVLLSHGAPGGVYGADGHLVALTELTGLFKPSNCPSLTNKPKIFIIQACQGKQNQPAMPYPTQLTDVCKSTQERDHASRPHHPQTTLDSNVCNEADFLLAHATILGFVSYRSNSKGSWFISKLVETLERYHHRHDFLSILTQVNNEICRATARVDDQYYKQTTTPTSTLRKKLFF